MNQTDKLNLERIIKENNVEDCTNEIRAKKHSSLIKADVDRMLHLKKTHGDNGSLDEVIDLQCSFLFTNYTDIFNKLKKDELNVNTLFEFLSVLKTIEDGDLNQHEGAYKIGKLLKKLYIDSALVHAKRLDEKNSSDKTATGSTEKLQQLPEAKDISWSTYKTQNKI
jgi:hypothetical protein